eukprot:TRINITY_DN2095_c0_g2_i1.p1 TRINITY_DN2095_c0_g2~~TRINITY_DN2095_c0_g2_i1.p1  ORF type:complete len:725 (-),score=117.14 TRINITY_DN2095_c0_g2_i1:284-2458(-)
MPTETAKEANVQADAVVSIDIKPEVAPAGAKFATSSHEAWLLRALGSHGRELISSRPVVACFTLDVPLPPNFPAEVEVNLDASVCFGGNQRRLRLFRVADERSSQQAPTVQIMHMHDVIETHLGSKTYKADDGPFMWPLHAPSVSKALALVRWSSLRDAGDQTNRRPLLKRIMAFLGIIRHSEKGQMITVLKENYGPCCAYLFARTEFFTQKLWLLMPLLVLGYALEANPTKGDDAIIKWQVMMALMILWGIYLVLDGDNIKEVVGSQSSAGRSVELDEHKHQRNRFYNDKLSFAASMRRLICFGGPLLAAFVFTVFFTLYSVTQLIVFIVYVWGDCVTMGCKDPAIKHGFAGFLAELGADILLAILFELLHAIGSFVAFKIAFWRNHKLRRHREFHQEMVAVILAALDRLGTFAIMAFFFVPQWEAVDGDLSADCSDLTLGDSDLFCMQRKMTTEKRRELFMLMFKGPFVVAPFVGIIVKVIVPFVGRSLDKAANKVYCGCKCLNCCLDFIPHLLALIFYYEGDHIGGFNYVLKGWQYTDIKPEKPVKDEKGAASPGAIAADDFANVNASEEDVQTRSMWALNQCVRKEFEPLSEELELKVSLLWVLFFGPIMPIGIVPTLFARVLECQTDMLKMLYVKRRPFPHPNYLMHFTQTTFVRAAVWAAVGWYAGLSLITFNDELPHWDSRVRVLIVIGLVVWFSVAGVLTLVRYGQDTRKHAKPDE